MATTESEMIAELRALQHGEVYPSLAMLEAMAHGARDAGWDAAADYADNLRRAWMPPWGFNSVLTLLDAGMCPIECAQPLRQAGYTTSLSLWIPSWRYVGSGSVPELFMVIRDWAPERRWVVAADVTALLHPSRTRHVGMECWHVARRLGLPWMRLEWEKLPMVWAAQVEPRYDERCMI